MADVSKSAPVAEVVEIVAFKGEIEVWMGDAPALALQAAVEAVAGVSIAACAEGPEAGVEAVKAAKKSLATARLRNATDWHKKFKGPVNAIGKRIDARNRELLALVEPREAELDHEIKEYEAMLERLRLEEEAKRRARTNERLQFAMKHGIVVDATDAEQMGQDEWEVHCGVLLAEKYLAEEAQRKRDAAQQAIQKQITDRLAEAHRLGAELSQEDAEYLTTEEYDDLRLSWQEDFDQRAEERRDAGERQDYRNRAADAGFILDDATITSWQDREACFMLWLSERSKEKAATNRLAERLAQLEELDLAIPMKQIKDLGDHEWSDLILSMKPALATEAIDNLKMEPVHDDKIPPGSWGGKDHTLTSGGTNPSALPVPTLEQVDEANAEIKNQKVVINDVKRELSDIQARFLAFGKSLPTEELKEQFRPIYKSMVDLVGKL